jgi:hypothetical protein
VTLLSICLSISYATRLGSAGFVHEMLALITEGGVCWERAAQLTSLPKGNWLIKLETQHSL